MKLRLLLLIGFIVSAKIISAQDVIVFKNGDEVQAKVKEVTPSEIKYIRFDNQNGPVYTIGRQDVFMIKYENGTKDVMADMSQPVNANSNDRRVVGTKYRSPGLAFLFSFLLPGGGQYYNHEHAKGGAMTGLWVASVITTAVGATVYYNDCYYDYNGNYVCDNYNNRGRPALAVGATVWVGTRLWSMIDAPVRAARINRGLKATGLLEFEKKDKFSLRIDPFRSQGLGGSLTMNF